MDRLRSLVKSFMVGMGVYFFLGVMEVLKYNYLQFYQLFFMVGALVVILAVSYFLIFKSEKFVELFFKGEQWEQKEDGFYLKSLFAFILFFALLRLPMTAIEGYEQIGFLLGMMDTIRDHTIYNEWNMITGREIADWVRNILIILIVAVEIFIVLRTDILTGLVIKSERNKNDKP